MPASNSDSRRRTTVRLPPGLHARLKESAALADISAESLIEAAIEHELEARGFAELRVPTEWGPLLARRFLECVPTPVVIKDSNARVVWCNFAYEDLFQRSRTYLLDRKITELGLLEKDSADRLEKDLEIMEKSVNASDAVEFWEPLTLSASRGAATLFRAHRFVFRPRQDREPYLGDISFDWGQILPGVPRHPVADVSQRLRLADVTPAVEELFPRFLADCPAAVAIKDPETRMVWCNYEYEQLIPGQKLANLAGKTTREIFNLKDTHALIQNEFTVARSNVWMYAVEALPGHNSRTSLRFPIVGAGGRLAFIGVVSAEFRQEDIGSQKGFRRRTLKARRQKRS